MKKTEDRPKKDTKYKPWAEDGNRKTLKESRNHLNSKGKRHKRFIYN